MPEPHVHTLGLVTEGPCWFCADCGQEFYQEVRLRNAEVKPIASGSRRFIFIPARRV